MSQYSQIDRSLVAIFDIEAFSERSPEKQARLVDTFLENLSSHLEKLHDLRPDAFSTGDGAIVSIGRQCSVDRSSTGRFLNFAITFSACLCRAGVIVRAAVNYSEGDRIVFGSGSVLSGQYIQVGDTINIAARVLSFCEPRELMITNSVQNLLRHQELEDAFRFHRNEPLVTKHGVHLDTYTLSPSAELEDALYNPGSPLHPYKRYTAFPPIKAETLRFFMTSGLDSELRKVVSNAYDAMSYINETKTFVSSSEVLQVLTRPNYDPTDTVYVVSRNDRASGFWTQKRRNQYIAFLSGNARRHGGNINQTRVWVYDENTSGDKMASDSIFHDLKPLHAIKSLYNFPSGLLHRYDRLSQLIFGCTLSKKHGYAVIPVPGGDIDASRLRTEQLGELLQIYSGYDAADGPMKAIITADEGYVGALIAEFENLIKDPSCSELK